MGIRLSIFDVLKIGAFSTGIVILCIATGIFLTLFITSKLRLSERLGTLIGVGTGICGASAVVATGPAIETKEEEAAYDVGLFAALSVGIVSVILIKILAPFLSVIK